MVIVCHDSSIKRIAGKKINIADVTYEELKQYDISYYFSKDHEFTYIPTLEEVGRFRLEREISLSFNL